MSFQEALDLLERQDFSLARAILSQLLKSDASDALVPKEDIAFNLAVSYAADNQLETALKLMQEKPVQRDSFDLRFNIALCKYLSSNGKKVSDYFEELMQLLDDIATTEPKCIEVAERVVSELCALLWHYRLYQKLEAVLRKARPLVSDESAWVKSVAHTLFMMDNRYEECCELYAELLPDADGHESVETSLLATDPFVLANLCVSLVLTGRNSEAEELIKEVESDESAFDAMDKTREEATHLETINLALGTLYCVKSNQEFGLIRVFKTFEPFAELKECSMKWFHAKRCILALIDTHCKQMAFVKEEIFDLIITFLKQCERFGVTLLVSSAEQRQVQSIPASLAIEARYLRALIVEILHDS